MDHFAITLGRADGCTLVFADPRISSRHARLEPFGEGLYRLVDLGSRNGTFLHVDGRLERIGHEAVVTPAQRIRFGSCEATIGELLELAGVAAGSRPSPPAESLPPGAQFVRCADCGSIKARGVACPNPLCGRPSSGTS